MGGFGLGDALFQPLLRGDALSGKASRPEVGFRDFEEGAYAASVQAAPGSFLRKRGSQIELIELVSGHAEAFEGIGGPSQP